MWNDVKFKVKDINMENFSISINFSNSNGIFWWLTFVYGPLKNKDIIGFWHELIQLQALCLLNWLLAGDFNIVIWESETNVQKVDSRNISKFNSASSKIMISLILIFQTISLLGPTSE